MVGFCATSSSALAHPDQERLFAGVLSACSPRAPTSEPHTPVPTSHCRVSLISPLLSLSQCDSSARQAMVHTTGPEENEEEGDDDEGEEEPHHASPTGGGSLSRFATPPPYHQQYMDEFQSIHTRLDTYQQDITSLTHNFSTFTTQYARDQERQRKHEADFWAWTQNPSYYPPPPPPF
ncbi:unnamed protein product [Lactuca saligna]|uniref:Uncharacterized protein n=1 Tax=Lactuca saligna TaxID=75948 RepID=A0AA35V9D9_LACSI|nr:unnamed protein product [Lactuca saligna]